jgi:hypothetical protein
MAAVVTTERSQDERGQDYLTAIQFRSAGETPSWSDIAARRRAAAFRQGPLPRPRGRSRVSVLSRSGPLASTRPSDGGRFVVITSVQSMC